MQLLNHLCMNLKRISYSQYVRHQLRNKIPCQFIILVTQVAIAKIGVKNQNIKLEFNNTRTNLVSPRVFLVDLTNKISAFNKKC